MVDKSAAIYGPRNKANISIFILHPKGRVSPIQEAQMTTVTDANVHNITVKGTFDDCQVRFLYGRTSYFLFFLKKIIWTSSKPYSPIKISTLNIV